MTTSASANEASIDVRPANDGPVKALLRLTETAQFLRSTDGRVHARVSIGGRPEIFALRSPEFRDWLIDGYSRTCAETPSDWCIRRVRARLKANARFQSDTSSVFIRVGHDGDANTNGNGNANGSVFYLDLADPSGQAVKIGPDGWSVVDNPHVNLVRSARGNRGRILLLERDRSADQKRHDMRNIMADEQLGLEPKNTPEKTRHAQVQDCQGDGEIS